MVFIWREQTGVKWNRAEVFSSHGNTRQKATQGNYILFNTKIVTEYSKVVFIAILKYSRKQWFFSLVVYWTPPPPPPPFPFPPSLLCLFETPIINEAKQDTPFFFLMKYQWYMWIKLLHILWYRLANCRKWCTISRKYLQSKLTKINSICGTVFSGMSKVAR